MLSERMQNALNEQINAELYSAYLYYAMSAHLEAEGLAGMAAWMRMQAVEEMTHVHKFFGFINERGGRVVLATIEAPPTSWESPEIIFEATCAHEAHVTDLINGLVDIAIEDRDHATNNFLQWFVGEQVEEEATASDILNKLKLVRSSAGGLFMIDQELGQRPLNLPPEISVSNA